MLLYLIYLSCLLFSFLIGFINRKALQNRQLSIMVPYLFLVFVQEVCVMIFRQTHPGQSTGIVYNIYRPITVCVFAWIFYHIQINQAARKPILWIVSIYLGAVVAIFLFVSSIRIYNSMLSLGAGIAMTLFGILFLFNYFDIDNDEEEKKWMPVIWITAGILLFYPVVNFAFAFYQLIVLKNATIHGTYLYNAIPRILSILMYSGFAYAFYLCRKKIWT
jgi:hypothetical protein